MEQVRPRRLGPGAPSLHRLCTAWIFATSVSSSFYAVSVFMSFLAHLIAMARFSARESRPGHLVLNTVGAIAVAFTLAVNFARGEPIASLAAALLIAAALYRLWVKAGRPRGIRNAAAEADEASPTADANTSD